MKPPDDKIPICDYTDSDYQATFWDSGGRQYEDAVEAVALKRLLPLKGRLLLEVGAGAGRNTPRYGSVDRVVLLDYSLTQLQQAQARLGTSDRYIYVAANVYNMPFTAGVFDLATMIRVLHHLLDGQKALKEIRRVMQPRAYFILEYANKQNLKAIARWLLKRQDWSPFSLEPVEYNKLNLNFHPRTTEAWLAAAGFTCLRKLTVSHFRLSFFKKFLPLSLLVWMDSMAQLTGDLWQLSPSVFVLTQADDSGVAHNTEDIFACPACQYPQLNKKPDLVTCPACSRQYPITNGIFDFRT